MSVISTVLTRQANLGRSTEFWGSIGYPASRWLKVRLFGLLSIAGLIAATAGPSSAILLIPRNRTWSTGGIDFNLSGTPAQLWPAELTVNHLGGPDCNSSQGVIDPHCPAGGYGSLYYHYTSPGAASQFEHFTINIADSTSTRILEGNFRTTWEFRSETWTQSPHMGTAAIEETIRQMWTYCLKFVTVQPASRFWFSNTRTVEVQTQIPIVRTVCIPSQNLSANDTLLPFPVLPEYDFWYSNDTNITSWFLDGTIWEAGQFGLGPMNWHSLGEPFGLVWGSANMTTPSFSLKSSWLTLPPEFGSTTAGLALFFPPSGTVAGRAVSCSIDARWARGQNWATSSQPAWQWERSTVLVPMQSTITNTRPFGTQEGIDLFLPENDSSWSRISASIDYLQGMTPPFSNASNVTTLEKILMDSIPTLFDITALDFSTGSISFTPFIEHVISTVVVDAIARTGSYLQRPPYNIYSGVLDHIDEQFCDPLSQNAVSRSALAFDDVTDGNLSTPMRMETSIEGYAYVISGVTMYFAACSLLLHAIIALLHVMWILWTRQTSSTWDRIPELLVLAHNSRPSSGLLKNTSGGIMKRGTFEITAKIEATEGENVELVLTSPAFANEPLEPKEKIQPGRLY